MTDGLADLNAVVARALLAFKPRPRLSISQWADRYYQLSAENSAVPGQWTTLPYQREPLDAMGDPSFRSVAIMKSARVGYTRMLLAMLGYHMHQDPAGCLVIQPTLEDARGFSKDDLQPMIRDTPVLTKVVHEEESRDDVGNTMLQIHYPRGVVSLIGANSGTGLRRISRKVIAADEVDAYPVLIGEGDVIKLAQKRSEYYYDRRFCAGSTPLIAGTSRIEEMFEEGDARRYFVPCPQCGHMAPFHFSDLAKGHRMEWPEGKPEEAFFVCQKSGCVIEHSSKRWMVENGEWRATKEGLPRTRSYHMWAALSYSPGATWADIAREFCEAKGNTEKLRVFVNTTLGETWRERGEAPDWQRLYDRRELYEIGSVPAGVMILTAGVDVQKDRLVYEVVGWNARKESWSIEADVIMGRPENEECWTALDALLNRTWTGTGATLAIHTLAIDSGYNANTVYNWTRRHSAQRVFAAKGNKAARSIVSHPSAVDVTVSGRVLTKGQKVWIVGVDQAKAELYGWLKQNPPTAESGLPYPPGYCHMPQHPEEFFKQLTAEHLVSVKNPRTGFTIHEWQLIPGRENHWLDCRVYARAAAMRAGLDRMKQPPAVPARAPMVIAPQPAQVAAPPQTTNKPSFLGTRSGIGNHGKGSWLSKKR